MPLNLDARALVVPGGVIQGLGDIAQALVAGWRERERRKEQAAASEAELAFKKWLAEQEDARARARLDLDRERFEFDREARLAELGLKHRQPPPDPLKIAELRARLLDMYTQYITKHNELSALNPKLGAPMSFKDWAALAGLNLDDLDAVAQITKLSDAELERIVNGGGQTLAPATAPAAPASAPPPPPPPPAAERLMISSFSGRSEAAAAAAAAPEAV